MLFYYTETLRNLENFTLLVWLFGFSYNWKSALITGLLQICTSASFRIAHRVRFVDFRYELQWCADELFLLFAFIIFGYLLKYREERCQIEKFINANYLHLESASVKELLD
jgi:hypothetical protein